jgi:hypothetical protein
MQQAGKREVRNPFGVVDVPEPLDSDVKEFAAVVELAGGGSDDNAKSWAVPADRANDDTIEGNWSSRWNGGADPTIAGDSANEWKQGQAEVKMAGDRFYVLFDWDGGARKGLIEARRESPARLVGKYINVTDPQITSPWIGLIVSNERIDGRWLSGRIDFRR